MRKQCEYEMLIGFLQVDIEIRDDKLEELLMIYQWFTAAKMCNNKVRWAFDRI